MSGSSRTPGARRARAAAAAAALLLGAWLAPAAFAAEPPAELRFPIDRITVDGARHASAELIVAESLLAAGRSYGEDELRQAVYRIRRLPFVLDTRFALRRGSEPGSYELVITVEEASPVFLGLDLDVGFGHSSLDGTFWQVGGKGTVGARWFAGQHGVVFGAVEGGEAQIGYTHYNLFGRRVFASFAYGRSWRDHEGLRFDWSRRSVRFGTPADLRPDTERFSLLAGFPLTVHQSVRFSATSRKADIQDIGFGGGDREGIVGRARDADVRWIYDSTDDPVMPTRGRLANVGVVAARQTSATRAVTGEAPPADLDLTGFSQEIEIVALVAGFRSYRPLSARRSLWVAGEVTLSRTAFDERLGELDLPERSTTATVVEVGGGYDVDLWEPGAHRRIGDLRFETTLRVLYNEREPEPFVELDRFSAVGGIGFVLRNRWGLFRFGFNVEEISGGD
jgi:hypothetical protein